MSAGFYLTSGFLYLNMAPEVIFVLLNRMKAQKIDMEKIGSKIISDIVLTIYKTSLVKNIIKPQTPIYIPTFYEMFHKIINSSALKLDKSSMEKLFYLILMTIKKQLYLLSSCLQLFTLTTTHFNDVISLLSQLSPNKQAIQSLEESLKLFTNFAKELTYIQLMEIREESLSMLQSYHSKIVLFIETGLQKMKDGHLIYKFRNSHNRKSIGKGINHLDIQISVSQIKPKFLDYDRYTEWTTELGKDDYDNSRGSSKNISDSKISKSKIHTDYKIPESLSYEQKEKSIGEMLKLKQLDLNNFELNLELFSDSSQKQVDEQELFQVLKSNKKTQIIGGISEKIEKEFQEIQVNTQKQEEIDLLDMMDN